MLPIALSELHGPRRLALEEAVTVGVVLAGQLRTSGVHLGHGDSALLRLGNDGVRVLDAQRKALGRRGQLPLPRAAAWLSPELIQGQPLDARTSVFSVGAVVVGLLTGQSPWERENVFETLRAIMQNEWSRPLVQLRSDVPVTLQALLASATARSPEQRPSLQQLGAQLAPFAPAGTDVTWARLVKRLLTGEHSAPTPDTDEGRLVRADELEEQGLDLEARWVRLECHVTRALEPERSTLRQTLGLVSAELGPARVQSARGPTSKPAHW